MRIENRLRKARESGVLEVRSADGDDALRRFGLWCWRLRLPLIWWARNSRCSRYGEVRLDLLTTGKRLTEKGQASLRALAPWAAAVSPHDAVWSHVPRSELPYLAARVLRAAVRPESCEIAIPRRIAAARCPPAKVIEIPGPQIATGNAGFSL